MAWVGSAPGTPVSGMVAEGSAGFCWTVNATGTPPPPPGVVTAVQKGTHLVWLYADKPFQDTQVTHWSWTLTGGESHLLPFVASVSSVDAYTLAVVTDQPLLQGVAYSLSTLLALVGDTAAPDPAAFVGKITDVPGHPFKPAESVLVDYLAPFVNDDGTGGYFKTGDGGDFILQGGLSSLLGVLWHKVLTRVRELYYDPTAGIDLRHKGTRSQHTKRDELALKQQLERVPYVNSAEVTITNDDAHSVIVHLAVDTDLGSDAQSRSISP